MFPTEINLNNLEYKEPQNNRNGGKVVHISTKPGSNDWKDRIRFQMSEDNKTNLQTAVWGLSTPLSGDTSRRTLELTIESDTLLKFLEELDNKNIQTSQERSKLWFKKDFDYATVESMYVRLVKEPSKPDAKPTIRVKVKCGEYPTNIYVVDDDTNGKLIYHRGTPEDLTRNVKCMVMCDTVGLWFMSKQFGMSLTAAEIMVWPNRRATGIDAFTLSNDTTLLKNTDVIMQQHSNNLDEGEVMVD
mgnify:FL=1